MPQVYLEIFAEVPSFRQSAVGKWFATAMLTREGAGHRLIIGIGPKTADLASPLKAGDFEAIFAESLHHGQPAGAWVSSSASRLLQIDRDRLTSTDHSNGLRFHSVC